MPPSNFLQEIINTCTRLLIESSTKKEYKEKLFKDSKELLKIVEKINENCEKICKRNEKYLNLIINRLNSLRGKTVETVLARTKTRLLVDVSSPFGWLVDEIGLAWHPILDTPYIPSSEIKGAVRAAIEFEKGREIAEIILGSGASAGQGGHISLVEFLPALPIRCENKELLEIDVLTPMYKEPGFEHEAKPTPITLLVVPPGVYFEFVYLIDHTRLEEWKDIEAMIDDRIPNIVRRALEKALRVLGIGAKTFSDYGRFEIIKT